MVFSKNGAAGRKYVIFIAIKSRRKKPPKVWHFSKHKKGINISITYTQNPYVCRVHPVYSSIEIGYKITQNCLCFLEASEVPTPPQPPKTTQNRPLPTTPKSGIAVDSTTNTPVLKLPFVGNYL
jgi:hypothetical protein